MGACDVALAKFKQPREVRLVRDLPRATLEKVSKAKLRQLLREEEKAEGSAA
jgi:crotonobetaine/carnitine-CoA ligase